MEYMNAVFTQQNDVPSSGRTPEQIDELIESLKSKPGQWAIYSEHSTRGAARQRVHSLKSSRTWVDLPLEWSTKRTDPGNVHAPVQVLVRWVGPVPKKSRRKESAS